MEFDSEQEMREAMRRLWDGRTVTGELSTKPIGSGRWRMELIPEEPVREGLLAKLPGRLVAGRADEADGRVDEPEGDRDR